MLYHAALFLNLVLDMILQAYLSYLQMVGVGAHTASGKLLSELDGAQQIFESYPMQKSLGNLLFVYCWPSTFFIPFLLEPLIVAWLPKHIGSLLVRSDPKMGGIKAAKCLGLAVMEQGRYADLLFNVGCLACVPFIAPAYLHWTLLALIFSHTYIYMYDHVKVLRWVSHFTCSTPSVHKLAQELFITPVSLLVGAFVFKASEMTGTGELASGILKGNTLWATMALAMCAHAVIHKLALKYIFRNCEDTVDR